MKYESKYNNFHSKQCVWNFRLWNFFLPNVLLCLDPGGWASLMSQSARSMTLPQPPVSQSGCAGWQSTSTVFIKSPIPSMTTYHWLPHERIHLTPATAIFHQVFILALPWYAKTYAKSQDTPPYVQSTMVSCSWCPICSRIEMLMEAQFCRNISVTWALWAPVLSCQSQNTISSKSAHQVTRSSPKTHIFATPILWGTRNNLAKAA